MNQPVSDLSFPIQPRWLLVSVFNSILSFVVILLFFLFTILLSTGPENTKNIVGFILILIINFLIIPTQFLFRVLTRANFHYSLEEKFLIIKSGVFSKQVRNTPYGIIQNVLIKQGFLDRLFGLATLKIENAAQSGGIMVNLPGERQPDSISSYGNMVMIPGLKKEHAEYLKNVLYEKIKIHPVVEQGL